MKKIFANFAILGFACVMTFGNVTAGTMRNADLGADTQVVVSEEDPTVSLSGTMLTVKGSTVDVGVSSSLLRSLNNTVNAWQGFWNGTNSWLQITNYMHTVAGVIPEFSIWEIRDGVKTNVWSDLEKFDAFVDAYRKEMAQTHTNAVTEAKAYADEYKAEKSWSLYQSGSGMVAPENTTWISTPKTVIAGGLEYQRNIHSAGEVWILTSNGMVTEMGASSDGSLTAYFTIADDDGNAIFSVKKTDSYKVAAKPETIKVTNGGRNITYGTMYIRNMEGHPVVRFKADLNDSTWIEEGTASFPYTTTWTQDGTTLAWTVTMTLKSGFTVTPKGFFQQIASIQGETIIENTAPVSMSYIRLGNKTYTVAPVTVSGVTVLGLTELTKTASAE